MDEMMRAVEAGDYLAAYSALQRMPEWQTEIGVACGAFLLSLLERFDEADALLARVDMPAIAIMVKGERARALRWRDPKASGQVAVAAPQPTTPYYAALSQALVTKDEALAERAKSDLAKVIRPIPGRVTFLDGNIRPFKDIADADDAIGQMLEVYVGPNGLLYFPFATMRKVEFLPRASFMDHLMPKVRVVDAQGTATGFVPLLYATSATSEDDFSRNGRMTSFDYVGSARRGFGQRDFVLDGGAMVGLQGIASIDFGATN